MRVLLSTYGSCGGRRSVGGSRGAELGAEVRVRAAGQRVRALFGAALNTHRASISLPPVDNFRDHVITDHPWQEPAELDVVQTGARILPDERPLPAGLVAFLDAGTARDGPTPTTESLSAACSDLRSELMT